jgi:hypothetical protein
MNVNKKKISQCTGIYYLPVPISNKKGIKVADPSTKTIIFFTEIV